MAKNAQARKILNQKRQMVSLLKNLALVRVVSAEGRDSKYNYIYDLKGRLHSSNQSVDIALEKHVYAWHIQAFVLCRDQQGNQYIETYDLPIEYPCRRSQTTEQMAVKLADAVEKHTNSLHFLTAVLVYTVGDVRLPIEVVDAITEEKCIWDQFMTSYEKMKNDSEK